jgi:hypothetical protein
MSREGIESTSKREQLRGKHRRFGSRRRPFDSNGEITTRIPHWKETPDEGLKLVCFCIATVVRSFGANQINEIIPTLVLALAVGAIVSKAVAVLGPASGVRSLPRARPK